MWAASPDGTTWKPFAAVAMPGLIDTGYLGLVSTDDTQPWVFDHISVESSGIPPMASSATTTALTAWHDHQIVGRELQVMAAGSVLLPPPTGKITLSEGNTVLTTMNASSDGAALLSVSSLPVGTHSLVATYEGGLRNSKSSSAPATVTILPKRNATVVTTAGTNSLASNAKTTLSAAISVSTDDLKKGAPYNAVTGWVQFMDGTQPLGAPQEVREFSDQAWETRSLATYDVSGLPAITAVLLESLFTAKSASAVSDLVVQ